MKEELLPREGSFASKPAGPPADPGGAIFPSREGQDLFQPPRRQATVAAANRAMEMHKSMGAPGSLPEDDAFLGADHGGEHTPEVELERMANDALLRIKSETVDVNGLLGALKGEDPAAYYKALSAIAKYGTTLMPSNEGDEAQVGRRMSKTDAEVSGG